MERTTSIGQEQQHNPALTAPAEEAFVRERLMGLLAYPAYYAYMAPLNRRNVGDGRTVCHCARREQA
jgi:hypothetical protein